jgi:hypothetical protein
MWPAGTVVRVIAMTDAEALLSQIAGLQRQVADLQQQVTQLTTASRTAPKTGSVSH